MDDKHRLKELFKRAGTQAELAQKIGVSQGRISQWLSEGVPAERVPDIENATGIPRHELRPDLWEPPGEVA